MTTATANYGQVKDFNTEKEDWEDCNEQMDFYFTANGITDDSKRELLC